VRPIEQCLQFEWPHALGKDEKAPLVWQTHPATSWRKAIEELARIKVALRTQPALSLDKVPKGHFAARHFLAYPVTHHSVNGDGWGNQGRLANQLRFKVNQHEGVWRGLIVHLPCRLPTHMLEALPQAERVGLDRAALAVWNAVHQVLDINAERIA
jgi:CRISPR-associated protein Cmr1